MAQPLWLFMLGRIDKHQLLALASFNHFQFNNLSMISDNLFPKGSHLKTLLASIPANIQFFKTRVFSLYESIRDFPELLRIYFCYDD